jgi:hypothetical protein
MNGHAVAQVMWAGLPPIRRRSLNAGVLPQTRKDLFQLLEGDGLTASRGEKSRARAGRLRQQLSCLTVPFKHPTQIRSHGDGPRLEKLRIPDPEEAFTEIHIAAPKPQSGVVKLSGVKRFYGRRVLRIALSQ